MASQVAGANDLDAPLLRNRNAGANPLQEPEVPEEDLLLVEEQAAPSEGDASQSAEMDNAFCCCPLACALHGGGDCQVRGSPH